MAGFLIYIPKWPHTSMMAMTQMSPRQRELLEPLVGGTTLVGGHSPAGPAGAGGIAAIRPMITGGEAARTAYDHDDQVWVPCKDPKAGKDSPPVYWLGWWKDRQPRPEDLARVNIQDGYPVRLGKHEWIITAIHADHSMLDRSMHVDEFGEIGFHANPCYESIVRESAYWHDLTYGEDAERNGNDEIDNKRAARFALSVLAINYRVDARVCSMQGLGLFDSESSIRTIIYVAIGGVAMDQEMEAKKRAPLPSVVAQPLLAPRPEFRLPTDVVRHVVGC